MKFGPDKSSSGKKRRCIWSNWLLAFLLSVPASGQSSTLTLFQYQHSTWTTREGSPASVQALAETSDGYLWVGSSNGLFRFDGVRFEQFPTKTGKISSLLALPDGGLWVGFRPGGVSFVEGERITNYGAPEGLPLGNVVGLAQDKGGTIWAAVSFGGLARLHGNHWETVGSDWGFPGKTAQAVFVDRKGTLFVATESTVVFLLRGSKTFQETGKKIGAVRQMAEGPDAKIWLAETSRSVRPLMLAGDTRASRRPEIRVGSSGILFDQAGRLWVTSIGDGILRVPHPERLRSGPILRSDEEIENFTTKDGLSDNYNSAILQDRENNIWVGTATGLDRFRVAAVVPMVFPSGFQNFVLAPGDGGALWVGSTIPRLTHLQAGRLSIDPEFQQPVSCAYRDRHGVIWLGSLGKLYRIVHGHILGVGSSPFPEVRPFWSVRAITQDSSGSLWISLEQGGIWTFRGGVWRHFEDPSLPKAPVVTEYGDGMGRIWFGYENGLVAVLEENRLRAFPESVGAALSGIKVISGRNENVWVGGEFGLAVFKNGHFQLLSAAGLDQFKRISGIIEARDGSLWVADSRGIIRIPSQEIKNALLRSDYKVRYQLYDIDDGLPGMIQQDVAPAAIEGSDGRLWFATVAGLAWIDPERLVERNQEFPVLIRSLTAAQKRYLPDDIRLPAGTISVQIEYRAVNLSTPEHVHFRYRLDGANKSWQDAGTSRLASLGNLSPGDYRFHVIASNSDDLWNEQGAILHFTIAPTWYQNSWFRLLCLAMAGCGIWVAYRWRIRQMRAYLDAQLEVRLSERTRIAQDLHDTLLQGVLSASIQLDLANEELELQAPAKPLVERVLELMRQVVDDGRAAVRGLRVLKEDTQNLDKAFSRIPEELGFRSSSELRVIVEGSPRALHPVIRDETYRIGREAAVNALRHSSARNIEVVIEYGARELRLSVRDDGSGMDPKVLELGRDGHWGLSGMRERAEKIGAKLKVWSSSSSGTEIDLRVPGRIAYESSGRSRRSKFIEKVYDRKKLGTVRIRNGRQGNG